jgi:hypothetical protein
MTGRPLTVLAEARWAQALAPVANQLPAAQNVLRDRAPLRRDRVGLLAREVRGLHARVPCPTCEGTRLKPEILPVTVHGRSIADLAALSIGEANAWLRALRLDAASSVSSGRDFRGRFFLPWTHMQKPSLHTLGRRAWPVRFW